ncbi:hypothetical protein TUMSATVNIG1_14180 [Vibrio nigripulchritudo]|nr:hypothetical protein VNTUMSATTG_14060 [Vibrio nigripulchritudo]BDU30809.1 hypothetical protein TUMSATVNIG1_14180 [Vibrio nigripulchritudo]BDU36945.1 hypothetical protein TUMSATVNIG2_14140 [Vibrio nigripulchritudo]BDU42655.1 hypothetical protein TUMSATVNIG3_14530 [Vibrio nigripulchritudo]
MGVGYYPVDELKTMQIKWRIKMPIEKFESIGKLEISPKAFRNLDMKIKSNVGDIEREVAKARIMESALKELKGKEGFDPAALSISFGLRW